MFVVGATYPAEMAELRRAHPEIGFLVPGIGAQGGDLDATLAAGLDARGAGLLLSSSRARDLCGRRRGRGDPRRSRGAARGGQPATNRRGGGERLVSLSDCGRAWPHVPGRKCLAASAWPPAPGRTWP